MNTCPRHGTVTVATDGCRSCWAEYTGEKTEGRSVQSMVRDDLVRREALGKSRYGTALYPNNGGDALKDLYEELLDAACYIKQAMLERDAKR